jgi:hypothetical protein
MEATPPERLDEWTSMAHGRLCEAALRLLAALGPEPRFPASTAGIEAMLERVGEGRPSEPIGIKIESPEQLPRYEGDLGIWVSPADGGCLRLRMEVGKLSSEEVFLRPDGTLSAFATTAGFGVPEAEWTEQARADAELVERRHRRAMEEEPRLRQEFEQRQMRFRTENLLATRAAPPQDEGGPVVTFVALYSTGVVVQYLVPALPAEDLESDDPWAEPEFEAAMPEIGLADELGTAYELADMGGPDVNGPLMRASQTFTPAVPAAANRLSVRFESAAVEIELGAR